MNKTFRRQKILFDRLKFGWRGGITFHQRKWKF